MPRHKRHDRPVEKDISLRNSLVEQIDASLNDPLTGKPRFGAWSELATELFEGWLDGKFKTRIEPFRISMEDLLK